MKLHTKIAIGLLLGAASGALLNGYAPGDSRVLWVADNLAAPVGQIFLRLLLMTVVPLVFASLTLAAGGFGDVRKLGQVGGRTLALFALSTALSAGIGLLLVNAIRPGGGLEPAVRQQLLESYRTQAEALASPGGTTFGIATFVNIVPRNPIQAAANMDMLGVIFFSLALGVALTLVAEAKRKPFLDVVEGLEQAVLVIIGFAMRLAPYGVFGLMFAVTARFGWHLLRELAMYVMVVVAGLLLHAAVSLSLLVWATSGLAPHVFWWRTRASWLTAFSTSSSSATLPTSIAVAEKSLGIPSQVAGFVLPLGATMNMNGTALYEGVTVLFLSQVFGVELSFGQQLVVLLLSVLTAVGAAGVPGGSLPLMMVVLGAVGVPPESIAIILGVDRILDMSRSALNVSGDLAVAVVVARTTAGWEPGMAYTAPGLQAASPERGA